MQKIYSDTRELDKAARENFGLTEEIMMENAAAALESAGSPYFFSADKKYINRASVLILSGGGNNGADGYALARRIARHDLCVAVCQVYEPKSELCKIQAERAKKAGAIFLNPYELDDFIERASFDLGVVYDCIFGSGFHGALDAVSSAVIQSADGIECARKIACDIPSGVQQETGAAFCADDTVSMGALKMPLFSDRAKDFVGKITVADLGVSRTNFESAAIFPCARLLEFSDARLPFRSKKQNSNKGTFGHTAVLFGEKPGAAVIAGHAALKFGSGLVTLVGQNPAAFERVQDFALMQSASVPKNASALVVGPGLGRPANAASNDFGLACALGFETLLSLSIPLVLDADIFYYPKIKELLQKKRGVVLTPHPKEAAELFRNCGLGDYSVSEVVKKRMELAKEFSARFEGAVLLLKGANILISSKLPGEAEPRLYINALGTSALAKGGSGDVLSGMIGALLAQGYPPLEAAASASLIHAKASHAFDANDYALAPFDLIAAL